MMFRIVVNVEKFSVQQISTIFTPTFSILMGMLF